MLTQLQIDGYEIEIDRDATAACYARVRVPGPEACGCGNCRNWIVARQYVVTAEFRHFLSQFGIPADGEIEVWETPGKTHAHFYGGWYFIVGRIINSEPNHTFDLGGFQLSFASEQLYPVFEFEGQRVFALHFLTQADEYLSEAEYASPTTTKDSQSGTA